MGWESIAAVGFDLHPDTGLQSPLGLSLISDQDQPQHDPYPPYYREVALPDVPSQYAEEVDTIRRILSLPDRRESMSRSSTSVMGLDDEKGHQRPFLYAPTQLSYQRCF